MFLSIKVNYFDHKTHVIRVDAKYFQTENMWSFAEIVLKVDLKLHYFIPN